jgi:hypothetical protein
MRRLIDRPIRSQDAQDLLEGKVTAAELEARDKAKAAANTKTIVRRRLPIDVNARETKPLSLAEQRARSRWQKPLAAIIANAKAVNVGLFDRLTIGVHGPDFKAVEIYQATFNELYEATKKQIEALEIFCRVKWSD